MYCTNCGSEVADGAAFCAKCGSRVALGTAVSVNAPPVASSTKRKAEKPLHGVGGWLGLLVIGMTVLGPFLGAARLSGAFTDTESETPQLVSFAPWVSFKTETWVIFGIAALISFCAGVLLFRFKPSSVHVAIFALWIVGPIGAIAEIVAANTSFTSNVTPAMAQAMWGYVSGEVIVAGIWTAYLLRSKRVKNTYYGNESAP